MISGTYNLSGDVNSVFLLFLFISVVLLVLITFIMVYFVIKYNRKRNTKPEDITGNSLLEIIWIVIPTILVLIMFYYGWTSFKVMQNVEKDAMVVQVTGGKWFWLFKYENGKQSDVLNVPKGKSVELVFTSQDVIHSFFIPAFKIKQDVVPGMKNRLVFTPKALGSYDVFCSEYCGVGHSSMLTKVIVMPEEKFKKWYAGRESVKKGKEGLKGKKLIKTKGCVACHSIDGSQMLAPTFKGIYERKEIVMTDGKEREITANEIYLRRSIQEPFADVVKGYQPIMPSYKNLLKEEEISDIIKYLKSLE